MKIRTSIGIAALSACALQLGCSHKSAGAEPAVATTSMTSTAAPAARQPSGYLRVDEGIRTTCNLPDDEEKAPKFDYDQAQLRDRGKRILDGVARCLSDGPLKGETFTIVGHADARGSEDYNEKLGQQRAETARDYLVGHAVAADRIRVESVGESQATGTEPNGWSNDRRVEVRRGSAAR